MSWRGERWKQLCMRLSWNCSHAARRRCFHCHFYSPVCAVPTGKVPKRSILNAHTRVADEPAGVSGVLFLLSLYALAAAAPAPIFWCPFRIFGGEIENSFTRTEEFFNAALLWFISVSRLRQRANWRLCDSWRVNRELHLAWRGINYNI